MTESYAHYTDLLLPDDTPCSEYFFGERPILAPLSLINIFVGQNNTGKSRLLRALFNLKHYTFRTDGYNARKYYDFAIEIQGRLERAFVPGLDMVGNITVRHLDPILKHDPNFISLASPINKLILEKLEALSRAADNTQTSTVGHSITNDQLLTFGPKIRKLGEKALQEFKEIDADIPILHKQRYYIPILRGMRPFDIQHSNHYLTRTLDDYFRRAELPADFKVFTGIELYQSLKQKLLGKPNDRKQVKEFEDYLSSKFFQSRGVTLIPYEGETTVQVLIGNEPQLPIYELGDGLQNLIICAFNIFMEDARCLFFMEEPDLYMHPSFQRAFLEVLKDHPQHQYFLTTHSNHLLDMTLDFSDISLFHFRKAQTQGAQFSVTPTMSLDRNILLDLGVRNSSVYLSNSTIWVEGITDRAYLRVYLAKYLKDIADRDENYAKRLSQLKEDAHYSFVEYQGSTLTHWTFDPHDEDVQRIKASFVCAHAFLIADGDIENKGEREKTYKAMLDDRFCILPVKEIENFLPEEILKLVVSKQFQKRDIDVNRICYSDYAKVGVKIGEYLDKLIGINDQQAGVFAVKSKTIKQKGIFCEKAVHLMEDPNIEWSLSLELRAICERIFQHILDQNGL